MKWLRAVLLGVIAAEAVVVALAGPRWRSRVPPDVQIAGVSVDGRTLAATSSPRLGPGPTELHVWDVPSGRRRNFPIDGLDTTWGRANFDARLTPDGGTAVVWESFGGHCATGMDFKTRATGYVRRALSTATGQPLGPQLPGTLWSSVQAFTADGHLMAVYSSRSHTAGALEWVSLPDGRDVHRIAFTADDEYRGLEFAPDGRHAAYLYAPTRPNPRRHWLVVVAVPSGVEQSRSELPVQGEWVLRGWSGDRVLFKGYPPAQGDAIGTAYAVDPFAKPLALEPLPVFETDLPTVRTIREAGPGWIASIETVPESPTALPPPAPPAWLVWAAGRVGITFAPRTGARHRVAFYHADGRPRSMVEVWADRGVTIAPDGRSVVAAPDAGTVEVWDADPPAPLPRAVAAGLLTAVAWAGLERWRARRAAR